MNMKSIRKLSLLLAIGLVACQDDAASQKTASVAAPADTASMPSAGEPVPDASSAGLLTVQPSRLDACDPPVEVAVKWDTTRQHPDIKIVEVWVAENAAAAPKLFMASMSVGEAKTGAWMRPGSVVVLKGKDSPEELQRVVIDGPACQ